MKNLVQFYYKKLLEKSLQIFSFIKQNKQTFLLIDSTILLVIVASFVFISSSSGKSQASLSISSNSTELTSLYALNRPAKKSVISSSSSPYAYFRFTDEQKKEITDFYQKNDGASLSVSIIVQKVAEKKLTQIKNSGIQYPFSFGLLYDDDFLSFKKLKKEIAGRPLVSADLVSFVSENNSRFVTSFCFSKNNQDLVASIPSGFFVYSVLPIAIENVQIIESVVGWDKKNAFFCFANNGGTIDLSFSSFDFTGASLVFPVQNTEDSLMPQFEVSIDQSDFSSTEQKETPVQILFGNEKITFYKTSSSRKNLNFSIPSAGLENPFSQVSLGDNANLVSSIFLHSLNSSLLQKKDGNVLHPYVCDPGLILSWKENKWRGKDYELFEWSDFPGVLYFDTKNYAVQSDFFRRLAFFVEKSGYRGKLLTDVQLGSMHGYNAHDYSAASLALFFTTAEKQGFALNQKEYLLRDILLENGVIIKNQSGFYDEGKGAVISISQESQSWLRRTFVAHEGWHGIFFTDADYRNAVAAVYYTMDQTALRFLQEYWSTQSTIGYDLEDTYLMHNELMAYLMQQPISQLQNYYVAHARWPSVQNFQKETADYIIQTKAAGLEDAAAILDSYAFDHWGFSSGRVWLINR